MPMRWTMSKRSSAAAILLCAGTAAAVTAPAAHAATASSTPTSTQVQSRSLLGGLLGGLTGGLTGGTTTTPTAPVTSTVTSLVNQLVSSGSTAGLPLEDLTSVVATLVDTGALGTVTDGTLLSEVPILGDLVTQTVETVTAGTLSGDLVGNLLGGGVTLGALPGVVDQLLSGAGAPTELVSSLVDQVVGDLLAVGLPTDTALLDGLLGSLTGGADATGSLLEPVAQLLDTLAANAALPADLRTLATQLAGQIRVVGTGLLGGDLLATVGDLLGGVAGTANVPTPVSDALSRLANLLRARSGGVTATPTTKTPFRITKAMRVKVRSVKVSKDRKKARAVIVCPTTALAGCYATSRLRWSGKATGRTVANVLRPGQAKTITISLPKKVRTTLGKRGGKLGVRVVTVTQDGNVSASRTETVAKPRKRR